MKPPGWLFPFTCGGNMYAIDSVMRLAESAGVTLIPVALLSQPSAVQHQGVHPEGLQHPQGFMEAVQSKAARSHVPVQCYEVTTVDVLHSITMLVQETQCRGIVLVISAGKSQLLRDDERKYLLFNPPASLVLLRLPMPARAGTGPRLRPGFLPRLARLWRQQDINKQEQKKKTPVAERPAVLEIEQRRLG